MRNIKFVLCDVFTDRAFTGNPLAVFTDARGLSAETMQLIAREMNLSETTFVLPPEAGGHAKIRIFTPKAELRFAGHPTLGSAFVLGGPLQSDLVRLETGAGIIPVRLEREAATIVFGWMEQNVPSCRAFEQQEALLDALGVSGSELPVLEYDNGATHVYVVLSSREAVAALTPDLLRLGKLTQNCVNVVAGASTSFKTRAFAPAHGVAEDPATGSAAGPLVVHMARHGRAPFGEVVRITQGVEVSRPSELYAAVHGSVEQIERVEVGGAAVIVGRGELRVA